MPLFRGYEQADLDLQYDSAARDPALAEIRTRRDAERRQRSEQMLRDLPGRFDVPYGTGPRETFDLFFCKKDATPLFVMIHGGYWRTGNKSQVHFLADAFLARGVHFAAINYPLIASASLTEIVSAIRRAILFFHRQAANLRADPQRIHIGGHSAGGHLAAMMLATDWSSHRAAHDPIRSVTAVSGLYDLTPFPLLKRKPDLQFTSDEIETLSPVLLSPRGDARLILSVGTRESDEFLRNRTELAATWRQHDIRDAPVDGACHFDVLDALLCDSGLSDAVFTTIAAA
jgi:arylformamidase